MLLSAPFLVMLRLIFINFELHVYVCAWVWAGTSGGLGFESPAAGVASGYELLNVGAGN